MKTINLSKMKKLFFTINALLLLFISANAQDDVYPTKEHKGKLFITNGTIHIGNGQVIEKGTIEINNDKIIAVGKDITVSNDAKIIDAQGQQIYPGLILPVTDLGLKEIGAGVRGSNDYQELGDYNPSIRSVVAYNTDSKVINTLRSNGILLACVTPSGGTISGSSSVVQLDAWNWEDAAYKQDNGIHLNMPTFIPRPARFRNPADQQHVLPSTEDDDVDQPYKTPAMLQKAGVLFALNDDHEESRYRNLPFNAGTAAAYGLGREEALQAITLNAAKILGVDDRTGSIEAGKDANIVISTGDILDMRTSNITRAIIQGRDVNLDNKQKQLYERYKEKYSLK